MASIVITSGRQSGEYHQLGTKTLTIGRDPARDIQLADPKVSRTHFEIRRVGESYTLKPFASINPVHINGQAIEHEIVLQDLDAIDVGETRLRFCADDDPARANELDNMKCVAPHLREDQTINNNGMNG